MSNLDQLAEKFCECTLPKSEWTHEAHLRMGLWHLLRFSPLESLNLLRTRIRRYNEATGGENTATKGYHETITRFYVAIIADFVNSSERPRDQDELASMLIQKLGDRNLPLAYWSRERLFSEEARIGWLEPNLLPLESASQMSS
jgi:hypothetical protein